MEIPKIQCFLLLMESYLIHVPFVSILDDIISDLYAKHKDEDGFLYLEYTNYAAMWQY